jgi:UPF0755 protein
MKNSNKKTGLGCIKILIILIALILFLGGMIAVGGYYWYTDATTKPASDSTEQVDLSIQEGDTLLSIAGQLEDLGLIRSRLALQMYVRIENLSPSIKPGEYRLVQNLNLEQLITILEEGQLKPSIWVTIPEGKRSEQIADILEEGFREETNANFARTDFMNIVNNPDNATFKAEVAAFLTLYKPTGKSLEGFLYPDTYNLDIDMTSLQIIEVMVENFKTKLETSNIDLTNIKANQTSLESLYEGMTLGSIIEKESSQNDDRSLIAGVFHNRLNQNGPLESDATVNYFTGKNDPGVSFADRDTPNPYNTYLNIELPPTPICNPRIESIEAALSPKQTDYYYFRHDSEGNTYYAETLEEHIQNGE